jgi:hypothetical protein
MGYHVRAEFCRLPGSLSSQLVLALERGKRANYEPVTLTRAEVQYQCPPGTIPAFIAGEINDLPPLPGHDTDPLLRVCAVEAEARRIRDTALDQLRAAAAALASAADKLAG